jgi:general secretion pathway protein J
VVSGTDQGQSDPIAPVRSQEPTGVQVALTVQGLGQPMVKSFLLGGT